MQNEVPTEKKILKLTVHREAFEVMVTGEKFLEFREPTDWIKSRLFDKDGKPKQYDFIELTNGYGNHRPQFTAEYVGFYEKTHDHIFKFSNGLHVATKKGMYVIGLGNIISRKNTIKTTTNEAKKGL